MLHYPFTPDGHGLDHVHGAIPTGSGPNLNSGSLSARCSTASIRNILQKLRNILQKLLTNSSSSLETHALQLRAGAEGVFGTSTSIRENIKKLLAHPRTSRELDQKWELLKAGSGTRIVTEFAVALVVVVRTNTNDHTDIAKVLHNFEYDSETATRSMNLMVSEFADSLRRLQDEAEAQATHVTPQAIEFSTPVRPTRMQVGNKGNSTGGSTQFAPTSLRMLNLITLEPIEAWGVTTKDEPADGCIPMHIVDLADQEMLGGVALDVWHESGAVGIAVKVNVDLDNENNFIMLYKRGEDAAEIRVLLGNGRRAMVPLELVRVGDRPDMADDESEAFETASSTPEHIRQHRKDMLERRKAVRFPLVDQTGISIRKEKSDDARRQIQLMIDTEHRKFAEIGASSMEARCKGLLEKLTDICKTHDSGVVLEKIYAARPTVHFTNNNNNSGTNKSDLPCRLKVLSKSCSFGSDCKYSHDPSVVSKAKKDAPFVEEARKWVKDFKSPKKYQAASSGDCREGGKGNISAGSKRSRSAQNANGVSLSSFHAEGLAEEQSHGEFKERPLACSVDEEYGPCVNGCGNTSIGPKWDNLCTVCLVAEYEQEDANRKATFNAPADDLSEATQDVVAEEAKEPLLVCYACSREAMLPSSRLEGQQLIVCAQCTRQDLDAQDAALQLADYVENFPKLKKIETKQPSPKMSRATIVEKGKLKQSASNRFEIDSTPEFPLKLNRSAKGKDQAASVKESSKTVEAEDNKNLRNQNRFAAFIDHAEQIDRIDEKSKQVTIMLSTPAQAAVQPARGTPKPIWTEPVLLIGFQNMWTDTYKCLTLQGTIVHKEQVIWDSKGQLGVHPCANPVPDAEMRMDVKSIIDDSMQLKEESNLKKLKGQSVRDGIIRVNREKLYDKHGGRRPKQYIYDRVIALDGVAVADAVRRDFLDKHGKMRSYRKDLSYDVSTGWIYIEVSAPSNDVGSEEANGADAVPLAVTDRLGLSISTGVVDMDHPDAGELHICRKRKKSWRKNIPTKAQMKEFIRKLDEIEELKAKDVSKGQDVEGTAENQHVEGTIPTAFMAMKNPPFKKFLNSKYWESIIKAYKTEMDALLNARFSELLKGDDGFEEARATARLSRMLLEVDDKLRRMSQPLSNPVTDLTPVSEKEKRWFQQVIEMVGWCAGTGRCDLKYCHGRLAQYTSSPVVGAINAVKQVISYAFQTKDFCLFQPVGADHIWLHYSDSDHGGNTEDINGRKNTCGYVSMLGLCPMAWGSKATSVRFNDTSIGSEPSAGRAEQHGNPPRSHPRIRDMHVDVSSAAAELFAASVATNEILHLSYMMDEMGDPMDLPFKLFVDNTAAIAFSRGRVRRSKLKHIDVRMCWIETLRDNDLVLLEYTNTQMQFADFFTKILLPHAFIEQRDRLMREYKPNE